MWNAETVTCLDEWYASPEGQFALDREDRLFRHLVSVWPRRGRSLLGVGCGTGVFLHMFWGYGFDVTGLDNEASVVEEARQRVGKKAEIQLGQLDRLPFEADDFDYVALVSVLNYVENPEDVLREALRVARRGVVVGGMNGWSLCRLGSLFSFLRSGPQSSKIRWLNTCSLARMARRLHPDCRVYSRSVLPCPPGTRGRLNYRILHLPLGAYLGMRIDLEALPFTPLMVMSEEKPPTLCPSLSPETSSRGQVQIPNAAKRFDRKTARG